MEESFAGNILSPLAMIRFSDHSKLSAELCPCLPLALSDYNFDRVLLTCRQTGDVVGEPGACTTL